LLSSLFDPGPTARAEVCEFNSVAGYQKSYAQLATILGRKGKAPPPGEIEFLDSVRHRPIQHPGSIGLSDYLFLTAFVSILAPQRVLEIGTLTGLSAAIMAAALSRQHGNETSAQVDTIDVRAQCLIDETRPTGFEIPTLIPSLTSMVRLHIPHDSSFVRELAKRDELEFAFIDANHQHPRPLLDLLRLTPYMRSGGWIVLHDIQLATIGRKAVATGQSPRFGVQSGAEWLFKEWPFRKISAGDIGAVEIPPDKSALIPCALRLMSVPFEIPDEARARTRRTLYKSFRELF
jgi:predicted O-methyltransferase YrrM